MLDFPYIPAKTKRPTFSPPATFAALTVMHRNLIDCGLTDDDVSDLEACFADASEGPEPVTDL